MSTRTRVSGTCSGALLALGLALAGADPSLAAKPGFPAPRGSGDLVIRRDGGLIHGKLGACIDEVCYVDGKGVPRTEIAWIGFSAPSPSTPQLEDPERDEARLTDNTVQHGRLVGVSQGEVLLDSASLERSTVAWLHLAAPPGAPPAPGEIRHPVVKEGEDEPTENGSGPRPPVDNPPRDGGATGQGAAVSAGAAGGANSLPNVNGAGGPVPPGGAVPSQRRPKRSTPVLRCPPDRPLGGELDVEWSYTLHSPPVRECQAKVATHLRFTLLPTVAPALAAWPAELWTAYRASEIRYEVKSDGCIPIPGLESCHAARVDTRGAIALGKAGRLGFESLPGADGYLSVDFTAPEIELLPPEALHHAASETYECTSSGGGTTRGSMQFGLAGTVIRGASCEGDGVRCMNVRQTVCKHPDDRDCMRHPDFYAVLPWEEAASGGRPGPADTDLGASASWSICCGCGAGPFAPPDLGPSSDRCPSTANADGFAGKNRDEWKDKAREIERLWKEYEEKMRDAKAHRADFEQMIRLCNIQSWITKVMIAMLAPEAEAGGVAAEVAEVEQSLIAGGMSAAKAAEEAEEIVEAAEKLAEQMPKLYQTSAEIIEKLEAGEDPTIAVAPETLIDISKAAEAAEKALTYLHGASADQLGEQLEQCMGTIAASNELYKGAEEYVESLKAATEMLPEIQALVNDVRQLDVEYPSLQYGQYAACVQRARCQGDPESNCDPLKPEGKWPPVP